MFPSITRVFEGNDKWLCVLVQWTATQGLEQKDPESCAVFVQLLSEIESF
jgi:hypothetical protein